VGCWKSPAAQRAAQMADQEEQLARVMEQTRRRLDGEQVPAQEKVYSLFERHTQLFQRGEQRRLTAEAKNFLSVKKGYWADNSQHRCNRVPKRFTARCYS
jgi:hypothetical protein